MKVSRATIQALICIAFPAFLETHLLVVAFAPITTSSTVYKSKQAFRRVSPLFVSVGLGPSPGSKKNAEESEQFFIKGLNEMPISEEVRYSQMSPLDQRCDEWFSDLLGDSRTSSPLPEEIVQPVREKLLQKVYPEDCLDEIRKPEDEDWTPYSQRTLRETVFVPPYGLENYGIPIPRRGAEPWRHFDVPSLVSLNFGAAPKHAGQTLELDGPTTVHANSCLTMGSTWLADEDCAARLVYIDGRFCPTLSKITTSESSFTVTNVRAESKGETDIFNSNHIQALQHLPDGFTDLIPVDDDTHDDFDYYKPDGPLLLSKLSGVDHRVGKAQSQFAMNNQQGTAAFAALNTLKCTNVALVDIPEGVIVEKPILIVNAYTTQTRCGDADAEPQGVSFHPRLLVVGDKRSSADIVQVCADIDLTPSDEATEAYKPPARLHNGYSQIYVKAGANITHTYVQENGGIVIPDVEDDDNTPRDQETKRPPIRDVHLECLDVHVTGSQGNYKGNVLAFGGMGRSRISMTLTLANGGACGAINGLMLSGGLQRTDMRTTIHHVAEACKSIQQQRNMLGGRASQTFKGRIRVEQDAQKTDSSQLARTILLTDKARVWAMPSLEIIADDVQCTHGATVSDLSEEELFYLRSRGLDTTISRNLLMYAFVDEICREVLPSLLGTEKSGLKKRIIDRLQNLVPKGQRAVMGDFQSV